MSPRRVVLVGFMGSGKSTVGRHLAKLLRWRFVDMDRRIEELAGMPISEIFAREGEPRFREMERDIAREVAGLEDVVVAAGGGAFAQAETRDILSDGAYTVYLQCDLQTLLRRIGPGDRRPLAVNRAIIPELLASREADYAKADLHVASGSKAHQVAARIADALAARGRGTI